MIIRTSHPRGFVCIDDDRFNISAGGIRLISGVDEEETKLLAKAMSLKLHTFGLPISGAKSGIDSDDIEDLYDFVAHPEVKKLISGEESLQYITGPDIGTSEDEYNKALEKAGLSHIIRPGLLSEPSELYGLPMDNIVTAWGVITAIEELLRRNKNTDPLKGKKISLEGFGKVGTGIAKILTGRCNIVSISTRYGSITAKGGSDFVSDGGLNIPKILQLQKKYGDYFIFHCSLEVYPTDSLFEFPTDVIIPGARTGVITAEIAEKIIKANAFAVVPVSNWPYTEEGISKLEAAGIICFPDFIASAGAVISSLIEFAKMGGQKEALDLVKSAISFETRELLLELETRTDLSKSMYKIAMERAHKQKEVLLGQKNLLISEIAITMIKKYNSGILTEKI